MYWLGTTIWLSLKLNLCRQFPHTWVALPRVLKRWATKLCGIFQHIFNLSVSQMVVPNRWKTLCLVPVPKKKNLNIHSHYRLVALMSHVVKSLERLFLRHLRTVVNQALKPLQFTHHITSHLTPLWVAWGGHIGTVLSPFLFTLYISDFRF